MSRIQKIVSSTDLEEVNEILKDPSARLYDRTVKDGLITFYITISVAHPAFLDGAQAGSQPSPEGRETSQASCSDPQNQ